MDRPLSMPAAAIPDSRPVLIAGGGIGGLATALTLHQIGVPCVVFEAVREVKALGVGNEEIARWTGLLGLAWVFKPLWSPLLEVAPSKKWLVIGFQFVGAAALAAMALALQLPNFFAAAIVVLAVVSIASASHDIACDGLYIASLKAKSRAVYAGWLGACFNGAM